MNIEITTFDLEKFIRHFNKGKEESDILYLNLNPQLTRLRLYLKSVDKIYKKLVKFKDLDNCNYMLMNKFTRYKTFKYFNKILNYYKFFLIELNVVNRLITSFMEKLKLSNNVLNNLDDFFQITNEMYNIIYKTNKKSLMLKNYQIMLIDKNNLKVLCDSKLNCVIDKDTIEEDKTYQNLVKSLDYSNSNENDASNKDEDLSIDLINGKISFTNKDDLNDYVKKHDNEEKKNTPRSFSNEEKQSNEDFEDMIEHMDDVIINEISNDIDNKDKHGKDNN